MNNNLSRKPSGITRSGAFNPVGRAFDAPSALGGSARGAGSGVVHDLRAHPVPATMVGIGIVGLAWLAFGGYQRAQRRDADWDRSEGFAWSGDDNEARAERYDGQESGWISATANGYSPGLAYGDTEALRGLMGSARVGRGSFTRRATHAWDSARRLVRQRASNAEARIQDWLHSNPLLVGAAATLVGAAVGSALMEGEPNLERDRRRLQRGTKPASASRMVEPLLRLVCPVCHADTVFALHTAQQMNNTCHCSSCGHAWRDEVMWEATAQDVGLRRKRDRRQYRNEQ